MRVLDSVRRMCDQAKMSTIQVSTAMGRAPSYVSALLSRRSVPRADTLVQVARACGYRVVLESESDRIVLDPE